MRKVLLIGILVALIAIVGCSRNAEAYLDAVYDDSINQDQQQGQIAEGGDANQQQGQGQGQLQGQAQGQGQGQAQGQAAIAAQGQIQGNLGIQKGNSTEVETKIEGDKNKTYANAWPALSGGEGVSQANAYSIFGGLGVSATEEYKSIITQIQAIEAIQALDPEMKAELIQILVNKMMDTNKDKRFLGLFWKTSGRNLLNLFGLLSCDSFWKDGQHPFTQYKED